VNRQRGTPAAPTIASVLGQAVRRLARARLAYGHGTGTAAEEAHWLVAHALGLPPAALDATASRRCIRAADASRALELVHQRIARRVPAAYLTNEAWLQGSRFWVDERVIVPRSFLAELIVARFEPWLDAPARVRDVLDLCTGSGCLAVLLARAFARARVDAVDLSAPALEVAQRNVSRHRFARRIRLVRSDLFARLARRRYDLIVSNPPYVTAATMRRLPPEYRHEPAIALAGGEDGFALVDAILRGAAAHLTARGLLVVEIGHHRRRLEAAYPRLPFLWPETSGGDDCVFVLTRDDLIAAGALRKRPAQRRAI
jgi:ribosomal protein L3 glutamine methyltransferase